MRTMRTLSKVVPLRLHRAAAILAILMASVPAAADERKTVVFVCLHGVVNSQMAAAYFNKAAQERGLPYTAVSRGIDLYRSRSGSRMALRSMVSSRPTRRDNCPPTTGGQIR
ncbi:MAG: hypothetical protein V7632_1977 [Bradyrhizobium sp.]